MSQTDKHMIVGDWPDRACEDCGRVGTSVLLSGPLVPLGAQKALCVDCVDSRNEWRNRFGKAMPTTDSFVYAVAERAVAGLSVEERAFVGRVFHLLRTGFMVPAKDWRTAFNHGLLVALKLDQEFQVRFNIHFRTGAALGILLREIEGPHGKPVVKEVFKEALPFADWNALLGWLSSARTEWRKIQPASSVKRKSIGHFDGGDVKFRPGDWVEVRDDGLGMRRVGGADWKGSPEAVRRFLENGYSVPEGIDDWAWNSEEGDE